jgi:hypothetical protein
VLQDPNDPDLMTPEERLAEVGLLLATGYLRHRAARVAQSAPAPPTEPAEGPPTSGRSPENDLDAPGDQSVHVRRAEGL